LWGGWGGNITIGSGMRATGEYTMVLEQTNKGSLSGTMTLNGVNYEVTGNVSKSGLVTLSVASEEPFKLEGIFKDNKITGINGTWNAVKINSK